MQIKRVIAGSLAALAAGATLAFGAGATTLGDFVSVTGNTMTSPYIVIGGNAAAEDTLAAADVGVALAGQATVPATIPGVSTVTATDGIMIASDLNKTYKAANANDVLASITQTDLPDLLQTLSFTDLNATTVTYTQRIDLGAVAANFGKPTGETIPVLFTPLLTSSTPFNLTVNFIGGFEPGAVDTSYKINLFGQDFTFGPVHTINQLDLYSTTGASTMTLSGVGDEATVSVTDTDYTFKLIAWSGATGVALTVNGQATSPTVWNQGGTYTIPGTTTKVYVNSVSVLSLGAQEQTVTAQLFVGTDKLIIPTNGSAISKNDVSTNSLAFLSAAGDKINQMTIQIMPTEDTVLTEGTDFIDPIFGAVKMTMKDMSPEMTGANRDLVTLGSSSTQVKLTFTNKDGATYTEIPVAYANATNTFYRMKDATYKFKTSECNATALNMNVIKKGDYFVVTSGDYSYVLKYENYRVDASDATKNYVTLTDLSNSQQYKVYLDTSDNYLRMGSLAFLVQWDAGGSAAKHICVDLDGSGGFAVVPTSVSIKTESGQSIGLAQDVGVLTGPNSTQITETRLYPLTGSNEPTPLQLNVTASYSTSGGVTFSTVPVLEQLGSTYEWQTLTSYGTYIVSTGDTNGKKVLNLYIPGQRPGYANMAIGANPVISTSTSAGGTINEAVQIKNSISKMESEVSTTALDRDLVLLGGPCANSLVAELLNMSASSPQCSADFVALYPTEGVISVVSDAFGSGQKALVVAGVDRAATRDLAVKVMQGTVDYSA